MTQLNQTQENAWRKHLEGTLDWIRDHLTPEDIFDTDELEDYFVAEAQYEVRRWEAKAKALQEEVRKRDDRIADLTRELRVRQEQNSLLAKELGRTEEYAINQLAAVLQSASSQAPEAQPPTREYGGLCLVHSSPEEPEE